MAHGLSMLDRARAAMERNGSFPAGALSPTIAESWRRCLDAGLHPRHQVRPIIHPQREIEERRERFATMRRLALAEMQQLYRMIAGSNFMIALSDPGGVVLDTISDQTFASSEAGRSIVPGSQWSEELLGTNALGLTAILKEPVSVHGGEHFFASHGDVTCMAAPIMNSEGELVGMLDASSNCEARQFHTLALIQMAAAHVENELVFSEQKDSVIVSFHPRMEFASTLSAGMLALSGEGRIRSVNRRGRALLSGLEVSRGSAFDALFEKRFDEVLPLLLAGLAVAIRDRVGSQVYMVCRHGGEFSGDFKKGGRTPGAGGPPQGQEALPIGRSSVPAAARGEERPGFVADDGRIAEKLSRLKGAVDMAMPIHIFGETGTGKELMARHIHAISARSGRFIPVNCGAFSEHLLTAELFGYADGAFTGARRGGAEGLVREADGGTLFLDEVSEMPMSAQVALLRFLDDFEVRAVGATKSRKVDVQIVSATNRELEELIAGNRFRRDLLYRLNAFTVELPPLRERTDFARATRHLLDEIAPGMAITDAAIGRLAKHGWPGNFRELRSTLQRIVLSAESGCIDETNLAGLFSEVEKACPDCRDHVLRRHRCEQMVRAFEANRRCVSKTARQLGISRTTLYRHVAHLGKD